MKYSFVNNLKLFNMSGQCVFQESYTGPIIEFEQEDIHRMQDFMFANISFYEYRHYRNFFILKINKLDFKVYYTVQEEDIVSVYSPFIKKTSFLGNFILEELKKFEEIMKNAYLNDINL